MIYSKFILKPVDFLPFTHFSHPLPPSHHPLPSPGWRKHQCSGIWKMGCDFIVFCVFYLYWLMYNDSIWSDSLSRKGFLDKLGKVSNPVFLASWNQSCEMSWIYPCKNLEGWGKKSGRVHSFAKSSISLGKFEQLIGNSVLKPGLYDRMFSFCSPEVAFCLDFITSRC